MGDELWYPLCEKMVKPDVPALVYGAPFRFSREPEPSYFVLEVAFAAWALNCSTQVFCDFPDLRITIGHGGGHIPTRRAEAAPSA